MKKLNIAVVVGDIGGCKELIPVAEELGKLGHCITWIVDASEKARAGDVLTKAGITFLKDMPMPGEWYDGPTPDLILIGTSATAIEAQRNWTALGRVIRTIPVVWYEDLYGTGCIRAARECTPPSGIITIDDVAKGIVETAWPGVKVVTGGKPTYGMTLASHIAAMQDTRTTTRAMLNVDEHSTLITYASMGENAERVSHHIETMRHIVPATKKTRIVMRFHPKLKNSIPQLINESYYNFGPYLCDTSAVTETLSVLLASDLVISDYGGDAPYQCALAGIPVIMTLFPDCKQQCLERGFPNGVPPLLYAEACWGARNSWDLNILIKGITGKQSAAWMMVALMNAKFKHLLSPNAAADIANIVLSFVK